MKLQDRVAVITGAAQGIGRACAERFLAEGAKVVIAEIDEARGALVAGEIAAEHAGGAVFVRTDVCSKADNVAMVEAAIDAFGSVDILVNNAGVPGGIGFGPLERLEDANVMKDVETKFLGTIRAARAVVPHMKARGWGRIIGIVGLSARYSSAYPSDRNPDGGWNYSGGPRNLAVMHLMRTLAHELGPHGITVNSVAPGFMRTSPDYVRQWEGYSPERQRQIVDAIAMKRLGEPADIAHAAMFLASPYAGFITGQTLVVKGAP